MQEGHGNIEKITKYNDGGTTLIKIADAKGKKFDVYFDHRIGTKTPRSGLLDRLSRQVDQCVGCEPARFQAQDSQCSNETA
jgi:hypothetical protein